MRYPGLTPLFLKVSVILLKRYIRCVSKFLLKWMKRGIGKFIPEITKKQVIDSMKSLFYFKIWSPFAFSDWRLRATPPYPKLKLSLDLVYVENRHIFPRILAKMQVVYKICFISKCEDSLLETFFLSQYIQMMTIFQSFSLVA